jgi:hypothetical protein
MHRPILEFVAGTVRSKRPNLNKFEAVDRQNSTRSFEQETPDSPQTSNMIHISFLCCGSHEFVIYTLHLEEVI